MTVKTYKIKYSDAARIELPGEVLRCLADANAEELRALILLAAQNGEKCDPAAAGMTEEEFSGAVAFLRGAGLITEEKKSRPALEKNAAPKDTGACAGDGASSDAAAGTARKTRVINRDGTPEYTGAELGEKLRSEPLLASLIDACENTLGKTFNPTDINRVIAMHDTLGLDGEYILLLLADCSGHGKKSLAYAERMACTLVERGIVTPAELEEEFRRREELCSAEGELRRLFGIGRRALTQKEKECFTRWVSERRFPPELINEAYEITVKNTREASIPYADRILENWASAGITTPEEARNAQNPKKKKPGTGDGAGSFDTNDFFDAAIKRSFNPGKKQ